MCTIQHNKKAVNREMAKSIYFTRIFGASPVPPLQRHMAKVTECARHLVPYFESVLASDWQAAEVLHDELVTLENEADKIKNELRLNLPSTLFLSIERRNVLELLHQQDKIANRAKDICGLSYGRRMEIPDAISKSFLQLLRRCIDATEQIHHSIDELDELVTTGFRGNEARRVLGMLEQLHEIEHETDLIQVRIRSELFTIEDELPPVHTIFLYKIIEWMGDLADISQKIGNHLRVILAK